MKAWVVSYDHEFCSLFHAETSGKAKMLLMGEYGRDGDFVDYRARRLPGLDDRPITYENAKAAGFEYQDESGDTIPLEELIFTNDCHCDICKGGVARWECEK